MGQRLRGGIVGCGFFGEIQREAWSRMPEVDIVAACDLDLERARRFAPRAYRDAPEMLERERLDFVDIATRPEAHLELVRLAAAYRLPVICQKPMAPLLAIAKAMVQAAEEGGIRLMIHENWRWQPWYRAAAEIIRRGDIGQPIGYCFRTRRRDGLGPAPYERQPYFREMPNLLIYETLVHHLDTARFLFGDLKRIYAQTRRLNPAIQGEDQALILLTHSSELCGIVDGHRFLDPEPDGPAMGEATFEGDSGWLRILSTGDVYRGTEKVWANRATEGYRGDSVRATQRHFIACLKSGAPFESEGREYLKTVAAVDAAYESAAAERAVKLQSHS